MVNMAIGIREGNYCFPFILYKSSDLLLFLFDVSTECKQKDYT